MLVCLGYIYKVCSVTESNLYTMYVSYYFWSVEFFRHFVDRYWVKIITHSQVKSCVSLLQNVFMLQGQAIDSEHLSEYTEEEMEVNFIQSHIKGFAKYDLKYFIPFFTRRFTQQVGELIVYMQTIFTWELSSFSSSQLRTWFLTCGPLYLLCDPHALL